MPMRRLAIIFTILAAAFAGCSAHRGARTESSSPPLTAATADSGRGRTIFATQCAACHGEAGRGGPVGPALVRERKRRTFTEVRDAVRDPDPPMPKLYPGTLSARDVNDVTAYVESL